jgi:hypothetical protein
MVETQVRQPPVKQAPKTDVAADAKKDRSRSFSYPAFGLSEAIDKARVLWQKENSNWVAVRVASEHWGFSAKSSSGIRAVAALAHFGLIEETGSKESRRFRLNQRAKTILLAPEEKASDRDEAIRKAALTPKAYQALWTKHGGKLPSDESLRYELQSGERMNEQVIKEFIKDFRSTVQFAKLEESGRLVEEEVDGDKFQDNPPGEELGDNRLPLRQQKGAIPPMPELKHAPGAQPIDLPIPLAGGLRAILRLPSSLTEENYKRLTENLTTMLTLWKPTIVPEPEPSGQ